MNKLLPAKKSISYVVVPRKSQRLPQKFKQSGKKANALKKNSRRYVSLVLLLAFLAVIVIAHYTQVIGISYQASSALREINELQEEQRRLRLEVTELSSIERIEAIARDELGLIYPSDHDHIYLTYKR